SSNVVANDWDVGASVGKNVSGLQTFHDPQVQGLTALRWHVDGSHVAMALWDAASGIDVESWVITNCDYPVSSNGAAAGILKNNTSTGSAHAPIIKGPLIDAGGNSWH